MTKEVKLEATKVESKAVDAKSVDKTTEKKKAIRRADLESQGRLYVDEKHKEQGYEYRIVNEKPGRIKLMERFGYEVVRDEVPVGTEGLDRGSQLGSAVTLEVGISKPQSAVLMRCPKEIYDERQADKHQDNLDMLQQTKAANQYKGQQLPD